MPFRRDCEKVEKSMKDGRLSRRETLHAFAALTAVASLGAARSWADSGAAGESQIEAVALQEGQPGVVKLDASVKWEMLDRNPNAELDPASGTLRIRPQTYSRSPLLYPFNQDSIWNVPIGDKAEYQAATLDNETGAIRTASPPPRFEKNSAYPWLQKDAMKIFRISPDDPEARWTYEARPVYLPWPHKDDAGVAGGGGSFTMRTPQDFRGLTVDGWAILIDESGRYYYETFKPHLVRDGSGRITEVRCRFIARNDLYGTGFPNDPTRVEHNGIRAAGISLLGGLVRIDEIKAGRIPHAIAMCLSDYQMKAAKAKKDQAIWPAEHPDNNSLKNYKGVIPMGAMFAIPWEVNLNTLGLTTPEGAMLARAYQEFGGYAVDTATKTCTFACLEADMPRSMIANMRADLEAIRGALCYVSNNASSAAAAGKAAGSRAPKPVGGGGAARIPAPRCVVDETTINPLEIALGGKDKAGRPRRILVRVAIEEVDRTAPVFNSPNIVIVAEHARLALPLRTDKPIKRAAIVGGPDATQFTVTDAGRSGWFLQFAGAGTASGDRRLSVEVAAFDAAGNSAKDTVRVTVEAGNPQRNQIRNVYNRGIASWLPTAETDAGAIQVKGGRIQIRCDGSPAQERGCLRQYVAVQPGRDYRITGTMTPEGEVGKAAGILEVSVGSESQGVKPLLRVNEPGPIAVDFRTDTPYVWLRLRVDNRAKSEGRGAVSWSDLQLLEAGAG
jgi:hypothetical protein